MKTFIILILLYPIFIFGQQKSATIPFGFGRTCAGGLSYCSEQSVQNNPQFNTDLLDNELLMLSIPMMELNEDVQIAILGKTFGQVAQNDSLRVRQPMDYLFNREECTLLNLDFTQNFGVESGNYNAFIQNDTFYIMLTIKKL